MSNQTHEEAQIDGSFGQILRRARQAKNISLDSAAAELNILKRHLQALEDEQFDALPKYAFARGFAINYGKYLGLDAQTIESSFDHAYPASLRQNRVEDIKTPLTPMGTLHRGGRSKLRINFKLLAACIGLVVLAFVLLKVINNATKADKEPNHEMQTQVLTANEQAAGAAISATGSAVSVANMGSVEIRSKGDVNVNVVDANGNVLLQGNQPRGTYNIQGNTPIKVEIDNPAQVDLNFNGQAVRLGEHINNGKASLSLQ